MLTEIDHSRMLALGQHGEDHIGPIHGFGDADDWSDAGLCSGNDSPGVQVEPPNFVPRFDHVCCHRAAHVS